MSFPLNFSIVLGASNTGLSLQAQLVDSFGNPVGDVVTTGFVEIGGGNYLWAATIPDNFQGGAIFSSNPGPIVQAFVDVNPTGNGQLSSNGLDNIQIEPGVNMRQAITIIAAALAGQLTQNCPGTVFIDGINNPMTIRITTIVDGTGQRLGVMLNLPT